MITIHKLKKNGSTIYPATVSDAIVHQDTGATLTEMINDYNVTQLYPTSGLSGGSTYDLSTAVGVLSSHLTTAEKKVGTKLSFTDSVTGKVKEYIFQGDTFSSTSGWVLSGDVHLADDTEGTGDVPEFDAYTDTLHVTAQELSDLQKTQARANLGLGNGNIDNEPIAGSENLVKSGGIANVYGRYIENPAYLHVVTDADNKLIMAFKNNGDIVFGSGTPEQIQNFVNEKLDQWGADHAGVLTTIQASSTVYGEIFK